jgi:hypothetical protein
MSTESGHWYSLDGKACHTQATKKGAKNPTRPTNLKDAREQKLLPSVTAYTKMLASPGLERWKMSKVAETCFASPPHPGEEMGDYVRNMLEKSKQDGMGAADLGTTIHAAIEGKLKGQDYFDHEVALNEERSCMLSELVEPAFAKLESMGIKVVKAETVLVNAAQGYAGTTDVVFESPYGKGILDWKSKRTKLEEPIFPGETHPMQLAAYYIAHYQDLFFADALCMNIYISTTEPGRIDVVKYDGAQLMESYKDFLCLTRLWRRQNNYDPRVA